MVNKNILNIRKKLDKLDNTFLMLIKKRTKLIDKVIINKKYRKRIAFILRNIVKKSKIKKIDPIVTKKIWASMINAYIDYEYRNFNKK